ncbi:MAG: hypothetical protein WDO73_26520 [Ignavibacteriota bacterium]
MRDGDLICAMKRSGRIAPMTGWSRIRWHLRCLPALYPAAERHWVFLRAPFLQQSLGHGMERGLELLAF